MLQKNVCISQCRHNNYFLTNTKNYIKLFNGLKSTIVQVITTSEFIEKILSLKLS